LNTILFIQKASGTRQGSSIRASKQRISILLLFSLGYFFCNDVGCHEKQNLFDYGFMMNLFLFVGFN